MKQLQLDVKTVLKQKIPFLTKIPFFVPWLKNIIHEKELNELLRVCGHEHGIDFAIAALRFLNVHVQIEYTVPLDPKGRYIFASNHPLGGLDGVALVKALSEQFSELRFPVNDILLAIENFQPIFLPINKHGSQSRDAVRKINEAYASPDKQLLMFPAGLVSRKIDGKIMDLPWQKHFVSKAIEYKREIVPVYIAGKNSNRFYRIARWRKYLGLPNIEMFFLPDEMFRQKNKTIKIIIGKPVPLDILQEESTQYMVNFIKKEVYNLA